jgi:multiple sugar transport system permease protein
MTTQFVGLKNYYSEITSALFWKSFGNTLAIWIPNIILQLAIALLFAAWLTNTELKLKGKGVFRAIFFFPNIITVTTIAILVYILFDWQHGVINQLLFGSSSADVSKYINWFNRGWRIQLIVASVQTWMWFGYTMIMLMAGIQAMPISMYEAATIDGASGARIFFSIVLPYIRPILVYVIITSIIGGLQMFDMPWVLFQDQGGAGQAGMTMSVYMYSRSFVWDQNLGAGSAVSWIMFGIIAIASFAYLKVAYGKDKTQQDGVN